MLKRRMHLTNILTQLIRIKVLIPISQRFSNEYLKKFIFNHKKKSTSHVFVLLICMVLAYAFCSDFYFRVSGSLAIVHAYINPNIDLSVFVILTVLIVAIIIMIASLYAIKHTTALFTKKLLEYKFNKR